MIVPQPPSQMGIGVNAPLGSHPQHSVWINDLWQWSTLRRTLKPITPTGATVPANSFASHTFVDSSIQADDVVHVIPPASNVGLIVTGVSSGKGHYTVTFHNLTGFTLPVPEDLNAHSMRQQTGVGYTA